MMKRVIGWGVALAAVLAVAVVWTAYERERRQETVTLFSPSTGSAIAIPRDAIEAERRAAAMVQDAFAKASGRGTEAFPIVAEGRAKGPVLWLGATQRGRALFPKPNRAPYDGAVGFEARGGSVALASERRESIAVAASWFLQRVLDAQWYMPGPLGESIPRRAELGLPPGRTLERPAFLSRDLGVQGPVGREWYARNRLEARFHHSHNLDNIFRPEDLRQNPEMAPMRYGRRFIPGAGDYNWQPNLLHPAAVEHAAQAAMRAFREDPKRLSFSLSENDSARFDASDETVAAVSPLRYFRTRPDYSDLVFGFANAVAERVAREYPDRYLPTYAYYWAEDAPRFPVAPNVVPYLTADRAHWFDPAFAAEDRALLERWGKSGAEIVGAYDYYYGAPFLIPRPITTAVRESIPFMHEAGVRAFYAEMGPNWALDGPKAWLAAQLLWDPKQDAEALLHRYYREFWAESAGPMRTFYETCERAWIEQPRPGYWIKFFQDEHQAVLFPGERRRELDAALNEAMRLARTDTTRARVEFARSGWEVSRAFIEFCELRDRLSREGGDAARWQQFLEARGHFLAAHAALMAERPQALAEQKIDIYLRNDPTSRLVRDWVATDAGRGALEANASLLPGGVSPSELTRLFSRTRNLLADPQWAAVKPKAYRGPADFEWVELGGAWQASGEPSEHRTIEWSNADDGGKTVRLSTCRQEFLVQWQPTQPGELYVAEIDVRARVSPGNQTFLIVNFLDEKQQRLGGGSLDRLPSDDAVQEQRLCVVVRAPEKARYIGLGVRAIHQVGEDFAEFSRPSLRRLSD